MYDFVIVGAGPSGLTLAYTLSYLKYRVVLIDKEDTIGGCHRVNRVDGLFSEHGPRIYSDAYVNTINILKHMGLNFYDLFSPYEADKWSFFRLRPSELSICFIEYIKLLWNPDHGKDNSVSMITTNFSSQSKDFIDRLCRMTDGAGSDRYTVHQFLQLFNQNMIHGVYIPKRPNDVGLFSQWKLDNVDIKLSVSVKDIQLDESGKSIQSITLSNNEEIRGKKFLLCIPPLSLISLLRNTQIQDSFGEYNTLVSWAKSTAYNPYIPIAFHWNSEIQIPPKWGFPQSDWGIAFIVMSRYMKFEEEMSRTVISTCIMYNDKPSKITGKTANQSTKEELIEEVFRQLQEGLGISLPTYTKAIPNTIYKDDIIQNPPEANNLSSGGLENIWNDKDKAFIVTPGVKFLNSKSQTINNLYSVGTHNGNSVYSFTTFESAVTNALHVLHNIAPESRNHFKITYPLSIDIIIKWVIVICIIIALLVFTFKKRYN